MSNFTLLKKLCQIPAPSGHESTMKNFILDYVRQNQSDWKVQPEIIQGADFQDAFLLKFGQPSVAVFAHMDSVGFMVRYQDQLIPIGQPEIDSGYKLIGQDGLGPIECELEVDQEHQLKYNFGRGIQTGTPLLFQPDFRETKDYIQCCYMDNRLGLFNLLKLAENLENGVLAFSCWEEHGGGSVPVLARYLYEKLKIQTALVSDITWVSDGVHAGKGVAISLRDHNIPRRSFLEKIIEIAQDSGIPYQLEVEYAGSSDGRELQESPYPFDWCFIGAPEANVHSPQEQVHKKDIDAMIKLYQLLMQKLPELI
ncbi:MAG: M20/M25/M40 family metallo-hydrolase [Candidatus Cyclobacteriaceae bacterium M3_2C_046]